MCVVQQDEVRPPLTTLVERRTVCTAAPESLADVTTLYSPISKEVAARYHQGTPARKRTRTSCIEVGDDSATVALDWYEIWHK